MKKLLGSVLFVIVMVLSITMGHSAVTVHGAGPGTYGGSSARAVLQDMTMDEKISQMIVPAFRTWHGPNVQDLSKVPGLAEALRKHQYGGIILFGSNIDNTDQLTKLVYDLQENNDKGSASKHIPYLTTVDEEGGIVLRFTMGTRMNGNMAIGATGNQARANAISTGKILGQEMTAMGFNTDFAPDVDVNNNPDNPVIGVRNIQAFSGTWGHGEG